MGVEFQHHMVVRQEHLNQYGNLFGGRVLSVIDELAFVACARTYPENNFVTRAVEDAAFIAPAVLGDLLEFNCGIEKVGRTSVRVRVEMIICSGRTGEKRKSFDGCVIMVCVDAEGNATPIPTNSP
jgi:acyl-CoA thioesterase YciA